MIVAYWILVFVCMVAAYAVGYWQASYDRHKQLERDKERREFMHYFYTESQD